MAARVRQPVGPPPPPGRPRPAPRAHAALRPRAIRADGEDHATDEPDATATAPPTGAAGGRTATSSPKGAAAAARPAASDVRSAGSWGPAIEALASYDPQRTCDATAKPGTVALRDFLLARYPGPRSLGISTACDGTVSEHHQGRDFDWGVRANVPSEAAQARALIDWLFATDQYGNR